MGNSKMSLNEFKKINNSETREKKSSYQGNPRKDWNNRNYNSSQSQDSKSEIEKIMDSIKKEGYRNESKNILRKKLIFEESQKIAEELSKEKLSNSQLRAFFNEIKENKKILIIIGIVVTLIYFILTLCDKKDILNSLVILFQDIITAYIGVHIETLLKIPLKNSVESNRKNDNDSNL